MSWVRVQLRGVQVWARCDEQNQLIAAQGRVDICYKPGGPVYQAALRNLTPVSGASERLAEDAALPTTATPSKRSKPFATTSPVHTAGYHVYTDGACTGNPGPMGIGVVVLAPDGTRTEHSEFLGNGTNNIAELTAIACGLSLVPWDQPVTLYTDSAYAIGVLSQGWKAKANQTLIQEIRGHIQRFLHLRWVKVAGHAGIAENERCDVLAREAIANARLSKNITLAARSFKTS